LIAKVKNSGTKQQVYERMQIRRTFVGNIQAFIAMEWLYKENIKIQIDSGLIWSQAAKKN